MRLLFSLFLIVCSAPAQERLASACLLPGTSFNCDVNPTAHAPMQSVFKLPVALAALDLVEHKKFTLDQPIRFRPEDRILPATYSPLQDQYPKGGVDLPLRELLRMAVELSDSVAADIVLRVIGGPEVVNQYINQTLGIAGFHLEDGEDVLNRDVTAQYRNWMTPRGAVQLLQRLITKPPLTQQHIDLVLGWMRDTPRFSDRIKGLLPPGTLVMHKPGTSGTDDGITHASNDIGLIRLPDGRYLAVAVFLTDSREPDSAARSAVIARTARKAYEAALKAKK